MFFLARPIVGSFYAVLAMIVLSMGQTTLELSLVPNSHAPALCIVMWGMVLLMRWWKHGNWIVGALAGLLLGYVVTIRYSEGLLILPIAIAAIFRVRWKSRRTYLRAAVPILAWLIPVMALALYNRFTLGHLTGYTSTNESVGFSWAHFRNKWNFAVYQISLFGVFAFVPLGVGGFLLMCRSNWRESLLLAAWFFPGTLLYIAYYWGLDVPQVWYLRFFLTLFAPLIVAGMYMLKSTEQLAHKARPFRAGEIQRALPPVPGFDALSPVEGPGFAYSRGSITTLLAAGLLTACAAAVGLHGALYELNRQHRGNLNMAYSTQQLLLRIKPTGAGLPMILADKGMFPQLLQHLQYMTDADFYANDIFAPRAGGGFGLAGVFERNNSNTPVTLQRERMDYIDSVRKGKTDADFVKDAHQLMDAALGAGRHIYVLLSPSDVNFFRTRFITAGYEMTELSRWAEPCSVPNPDQRNFLAPPVWPDDIILPWHPQSWTLLEITRPAKRG
jgi:hypothetical protein